MENVEARLTCDLAKGILTETKQTPEALPEACWKEVCLEQHVMGAIKWQSLGLAAEWVGNMLEEHMRKRGGTGDLS